MATDSKALSRLVYDWTAADKLQRVWRKSWRFRSTLELVHLFLSNYSKEIISKMKIDAVGALVRKEMTKFWVSKIITRILNKMRLRDKTGQKDIATNCNTLYFVSCMPLLAQQTLQWVDAMCLLQCKELTARLEQTWITLEEIMVEIQKRKGVLGDHLDAAFDRLYKQFGAFTELYRFTVLNSEAVNASKAKESILSCKDDLMGLEADCGFKIHQFGQHLKKKIEANMASHTKKLKQLVGAMGYRFFEEGQLREKTERNVPSTTLNEKRSFYFLSSASDAKATIHEVVHYSYCNVDYGGCLKMPSIWQCGHIQQLYERDLFNRLLKEQTQIPIAEQRVTVQEGLQYLQQGLFNYLEPIPKLYDEAKLKFQEQEAKNGEGPFTTQMAENNLHYMFELLKTLSTKTDLYAQRAPAPLSQIQTQIQDSRWDVCFQQKNSSGVHSYAPQIRMLFEMLSNLVLKVTALSVSLQLAPYHLNFIQYEKEKVALSINVEHTTRWLSPFILAQQEEIISKKLLQELHLKATWKLILLTDGDKRKNSSFVWPETFRLDIPTLHKLEEDLIFITKVAVGYQVVSALKRSNPQITLESFTDEFQHSISFNDFHLDIWLERNGVSNLKRAYLLPLIRMKQSPKHPVFIATQHHLLKNLMADAQEPLSADEDHGISDYWMLSGCKGKRVKMQFLQLVRNNFAIYSERYEQIVQACLELNNTQ